MRRWQVGEWHVSPHLEPDGTYSIYTITPSGYTSRQYKTHVTESSYSNEKDALEASARLQKVVDGYAKSKKRSTTGSKPFAGTNPADSKENILQWKTS